MEVHRLGRRCEVLATVTRLEHGGELAKYLKAWLSKCVPNVTTEATEFDFDLDLRCTLYQVLLAFSFLQQERPHIAHNDVHFGQLLLREPLSPPRCTRAARATSREDF